MQKTSHPALIVIDRWLKYQCANSELPGTQVSIRHRQNLIFSKAYGYADSVKKEVYTSKHVARIASHSKLFTSALALLFQSQSRLRLSDLVVNYLPEFRQHRDPRFKKITLQDLLTNRSGLFRDGDDCDFWSLKSPFLSKSELVKELLAADLVYSPDRYTKYSNMGFSLMGLVLEKVGGENYNTLVTQHIISRLGKTRLAPEYSDKFSWAMAKGHLRRRHYGQSFKTIDHSVTNALSAATGFCGNSESTTDFLQKLHQTNLILPTNARAKLLKSKWPVKSIATESYGLGTIFSKVNDSVYIGHSGGFPGFTSQTWSPQGSNYFFSFITNTNAVATFNAIRSMHEIIQKIETTFTRDELSSAIVSPPMADNFISTIYVVSKRKALAFPLTGWLPTSDIMEFQKHKDYFRSDNIRGYSSVGEPLRFYFKGKNIAAVKHGGFTSIAE